MSHKPSSAKSKRGKGPFRKDSVGVHVFVLPLSEETAKLDFVEGWIVSCDEEVERRKEDDSEPEPGLRVIHADGYLREYWTQALVHKNDAEREYKGPGAEPVYFYLGDGPQLSKSDIQQKMKQRKHLGGGEAGRAALKSGNFRGRRLSVWWPGEERFYSGVAFEMDPKNPNRWQVGFDEDGDMEWYDLTEEQWTLERTQVLVQDETIGMMVHFDEATGRPCEVNAFVACKAGDISTKVGRSSIIVNCTPKDKKARKQNHVFIYPRKLQKDAARACVDKNHHVKVTVPIVDDEN